MSPHSIAISGIQSAQLRLNASAHNVANLTTPSFRPLRVEQSAVAGGGSTARVTRSPDPSEVDLVREIIDQIRAKTQFMSSVRFAAVAVETRGTLVDLLV